MVKWLRGTWRAFATWFAEPTEYHCRACRREGHGSFVEKEACKRHPEVER